LAYSFLIFRQTLETLPRRHIILHHATTTSPTSVRCERSHFGILHSASPLLAPAGTKVVEIILITVCSSHPREGQAASRSQTCSSPAPIAGLRRPTPHEPAGRTTISRALFPVDPGPHQPATDPSDKSHSRCHSGSSPRESRRTRVPVSTKYSVWKQSDCQPLAICGLRGEQLSFVTCDVLSFESPPDSADALTMEAPERAGWAGPCGTLPHPPTEVFPFVQLVPGRPFVQGH
jgi:hypothetical protein